MDLKPRHRRTTRKHWRKWLLIFCVSLLLGSVVMAEGDNAVVTDDSAPPLAPVEEILTSSPSRLISLNFNNIETRQLLQIFAQFTGLNFVISDSVKGSMSVHFDSVPWPQALDVILKSQGLTEQRMGKIMLIAPIQEMALHKIQKMQAALKLKELQRNSEIKALEAKQRMDALSPLYNAIIPLHYAKAAEIVKTVVSSAGSLLAPRGQISVDPRTNSLWVRATFDHLQKIRQLIKKLDYPVKQVVIEARIVDIERPFEKELGVRFGVTSSNHLTGTLAAANTLSSGTPATTTPATLNYTDRLNFDMPATTLFTRPWSIGLAVARLGGNTLLDLELSAMETEGKIQLVSTPSLVTADNQPAYIRTGQEIPYEVSSSSGATSIEYKQAELSLEVTPQIIADKRVILSLKVTNNSAGAAVLLNNGGQAIPINTQEEQSQVLLNNGQTIVLGGIYTQDKRKIVTRVPFLGRIPILGYLFTHKSMRDTRRELLIFLTPKIITRPAMYTQTPEQHEMWKQSKSAPMVKIPPHYHQLDRVVKKRHHRYYSKRRRQSHLPSPYRTRSRQRTVIYQRAPVKKQPANRVSNLPQPKE